MKQTTLVFILITLLFSCRTDPMPDNAIDREKFVNILVDVHLAEALYQERYRIRIDSLESGELYKSILQKHDVSEDEMIITSMYYSRHQREYDKIFNDVLTKMNVRIDEEKQLAEPDEEKQPAEKDIQPEKKDSIKK
jgi:hypothetical protein